MGHPVKLENGMERIALIGEGMNYISNTNTNTADILFLGTLRSKSIPISMYTQMQESVIQSCFIEKKYTHQAITHLYRAFEFHRNGK